MIFTNDKNRQKKFQRKVATFAQVNYPKINPHKIEKSTLCLRNSNCHNNSVAAFNAGRADSVWLVIAGNDDHMCVHFIASKNGKYFDDTWMYENHHYHVIRKVRESEFEKIGDLLIKTKQMFYDLFGCAADIRAFNKDNNVDI